jgi:hypothetical protein
MPKLLSYYRITRREEVGEVGCPRTAAGMNRMRIGNPSCSMQRAAENGSRARAQPRNDVASRSNHTWETLMNHLLNDIVHVARNRGQIYPMLKLVMHPPSSNLQRRP